MTSFFSRKKKYSLTLIELLVAIFLTGILLTLLWQTYHVYVKQASLLRQKQQDVYKVLFVKQRIDKLFAQGIRCQSKTSLFTPKQRDGDSCSFCLLYEGGPDPDPSFNGPLRSLLYVDDRKRLCLATWSFDRKSTVEVLQEDILSFSLSYFHKDHKVWQQEWPETITQLPLWVRCTYTTPKGEEILTFQVQMPEDPIIYPPLLP